ncbi:MAG: amidohydrolase family protein [Pirellula sp.]
MWNHSCLSAGGAQAPVSWIEPEALGDLPTFVAVFRWVCVEPEALAESDDRSASASGSISKINRKGLRTFGTSARAAEIVIDRGESLWTSSTVALALSIISLIAGMFVCPMVVRSDEPVRFDLLLRNGEVHVGDGTPGVQADVAILNERIAAIGKDLGPADRELNCGGMVVCPGFIDLHTHSDGPIVQRDTRANVNYLLQGCTTSVTGNCGSGPTDVGKYLGEVDRDGAGTHVIHLLPHGSLRERVMGKEDRLPTSEELNSMREIASVAMQDGAFGMSTGLIYIPGTFAKTEELIEIAKVVAKHQGIYASHIRNEGTQLIESIDEAVRIGNEAKIPVHISHFKASGKPSWGSLHLAAALIDKKRGEGMQITADQYPYTASSTSLEATLLPSWAREGGRDSLEKRLADPATALRVRSAIQKSLESTYRIQLATCKSRPEWIGLSLDQIAANEKMEVVDIVMKIEMNGGASVVNFGMNENDVRLAMKFPWLATASDGGAKVPTASQPHPRSFGTFPRKIGRYAIEEGVLTMEAAIRSSSSLPADILGLSDRGRLTQGLVADIVVFDPKTFRDQATYDEPYRTPSGIQHVLVAGKLAVFAGQATGALAGRAIRKTKTQPATKTSSIQQAIASWSVDKLVGLIQPNPATGPDYSTDQTPFASIDFNSYAGELRQLPIGIFDSGIGGLTVLEAILASDLHDNQSGKPGADGVPDFQAESFIYLGDQANMPYGNYSEKGKEDLLRELIIKDTIFLLGNRYWPHRNAPKPMFDKPPVKAVVIACNTATAFGLEDLRKALKRWNLPVISVGVVEAGATSIMDRIHEERNSAGAVAVLATLGTCNSGAYPRAIGQNAGRRGMLVPRIAQQGSLGLAGAIEGDPAFVSKGTGQSAVSIQYRGPAMDRTEAPIDPELIPQYDFNMQEVIGDTNTPSSWKLNSIDNYIRYDVTTLIENYRKLSPSAPVPIRYVMLGCTHFPFESERIEQAFARLRSYKSPNGEFPYQAWIAEKIQIVNPAQLTAKDLFRELFLKRMLTKPATSVESHHRLFLSVPNVKLVPETGLDQGWLTYDFKYGRAAGEYEREYTHYVPMEPGLLPAPSISMLRSYAPNVCKLIGLQ